MGRADEKPKEITIDIRSERYTFVLTREAARKMEQVYVVYSVDCPVPEWQNW